MCDAYDGRSSAATTTTPTGKPSSTHLGPGTSPGGFVAMFAVLVRRNCEFSTRIEVEADDEASAIAPALTQAQGMPIGSWQPAWSPMDADPEEVERL